MITCVTNDKCHEYRGLSSDNKPIDDSVGNGSVYVEMDTKKVFLFNEDNKEWLDINAQFVYNL